jgi:hypothetical protein
MNRVEQVQALAERIRHVCKPHARFRTLWVVGRPKSGKTALCREVCLQTDGYYVNFTLEPGYLDSLINKERTYRPEDFLGSLRSWCKTCPSAILVLDEIEPMLGLWTPTVQIDFFRTVGRVPRLERGLVIVTRLYDAQDILKWVPNHTHVFEVTSGGAL